MTKREESVQPDLIKNEEQIDPRQPRKPFWSARFLIFEALLLTLVGLSAYLEYSVYPSLMRNSFGETQIVLHVSLLTFSFNANRCIGQTCSTVIGLPSFDFAQLFTIFFIGLGLYHLINVKKI
ncbi:MAG: hypothetical protein ACYCQJ_08055 [Nitrososphaerales archaeon]